MTKPHAPPAPMKMWLAESMPEDVAQVLWRLRRLKDMAQVAVMPDVHLAQDVCIGTVLATTRLLYPAAVGGDIGCGMAAVAFDCPASAIDRPETAAALLESLHETVSIIRRHTPAGVAWLSRTRLSDPTLEHLKERDGRVELGSLGRGNHFLEFQEDLADGRLWLMLHTGSRCMGQAIRDHYVAHADGSCMGLRYLHVDGPAGRAYLHDAGWARGFAAISRQVIALSVVGLLKDRFGIRVIPGTYFQRDHNHVVPQLVGRRRLWVHRKGAMDASPGRLGVIPGSMGSPSYHVLGRGCPESLCSSSHGAGRAMTRERARRNVSEQSLVQQMQGVWFDRHRAGRLTEEAPSAYKDVTAVMRAQRTLTRIIRELRPVLSYKGS